MRVGLGVGCAVTVVPALSVCVAGDTGAPTVAFTLQIYNILRLKTVGLGCFSVCVCLCVRAPGWGREWWSYCCVCYHALNIWCVSPAGSMAPVPVHLTRQEPTLFAFACWCLCTDVAKQGLLFLYVCVCRRPGWLLVYCTPAVM